MTLIQTKQALSVTSTAPLTPVRPGDHARGPLDAAITVVEYGDYQCPDCREAYPILNRLTSEFADSICLVFRNLPFAAVHPHAEPAAEVAEAVGAQGKFWEFHDTLFECQTDLSITSLFTHVGKVSANLRRVKKDIAEGGPRRRVRADFDGGIRSGANSTPTLFVNGVRYDGSWRFEPLSAYLTSVIDG